MQVDDKQQLLKKKQALMSAISNVVKNLLEKSGKSGRKISDEYDIGLGVISKIERNIVSDVKLSTIWKLSNAFGIAPVDFIKMISNELPNNFSFYD